MIEAGTVLQNRYSIEKQIGQGGMGAVYIATDERFGSTVAIKETLFLDEKFRKAFEREARLLNSLRHSALPRVSDHFMDGNGQFLVMEYIDGDDLSEMMEHDGKAFALSDVLNWTDQLLDALDFLHTQEMPVIHRDIKPQNLKLTKRGQIILLDFGLAKGNPTNPESATAAKSVFGYSRNYASLEQIQGTGTDPRSDLYSLAATLYHLVTGVPPADALTRAMNVLSEKEDPLIPVNEINPDIPESVAEVLHKAMALNASQRPISAQAMRSMLLESEKEAAEDLKTVADKRLETNIFTQKTEVLPVPTALKQSDVKTEVLAANAAEETAIERQVTGDFDAEETRVRTQPEKPRRKFAAVATALGALLLCGVALAAIYINSFESGGGAAEPMTVANTVENAAANVAIANAETVNTATGTGDSTMANAVRPSEAKADAKENPSKSTDTTKSETKDQTSVGQTDSPTAGTAVGVPPPQTPPKQDIPPVDQRFPNKPPQIPADVWQRMTPQQRVKMKRALEMQRRQQQNRPLRN